MQKSQKLKYLLNRASNQKVSENKVPLIFDFTVDGGQLISIYSGIEPQLEKSEKSFIARSNEGFFPNFFQKSSSLTSRKVYCDGHPRNPT